MELKYCPFCMNELENNICPHCHKDNTAYQSAPHHLQPGTILNNKYLIGAVLGEGGFGITYIGKDINLDLRVAIKEYFPSGIVNRNNTCSAEISAHIGDSQSLFEKGKNSFLTEARTLAKFSSEPNIVSVYDFFSSNNTAYIVMEFLEGIDLKEYITQNGVMNFNEVYSMLSPVMTVLNKIHESGLIHRDISPANIMVLNDGSVKLLDFGAARDISGTDEKSLSILLKPGYAPEEQYRTKGHQGPWTDVYALSATMYKMLTGVTPEDAMNRLFSDDLRKISELNPAVTSEQEQIVLKGMAVQQADRYQSMSQLQADCKAAVEGKKSVSTEKVSSVADTSSWMEGWNDTAKGKKAKTVINKGEKISAQKGDKKPNMFGLVGSIIFGLLSMYCILNLVSLISDSSSNGGEILSIVLAVIFGGLTVLCGRLYFPRIDNKKLKPNVFCFILSIISGLATGVTLFSVFVNNDDSLSVFGVALTLCVVIITLFLGYFYYPRLERKKRNKYIKIFGGITASIVLLFVVAIVYLSLNTISIGDEKIKRNATSVSLSFDIITDHDLSKLKELKNLQSLDILECFLDDEDVKVIGELTSLQKLSLTGNTDITDVSPLNNLTSLTYLRLDLTNTKDINCLDKLVNLETLSISGTDVPDVSVVATYSKLETFDMSSLENLDESTINLPSSIEVLNCSYDKLSKIDFVSSAESITSLNASNNEISDIKPLDILKSLWDLNLASNNISDISSIHCSSLNSLNLTDNQIADISVLSANKKGPYQLRIGCNQISDISPLKDNSGLGIVELNNNKITDISALCECFKIYSLDISYNQIADISPIATIDNLTIFKACNNLIVDITPIKSSPLLKDQTFTLDLSNNRIQSVEPLRGFKSEVIYLSNNEISDISVLATCENLKCLKINNNKVSDITSLFALKQLNILEVVSNPIADLGNLSMNPDTLFGFSTFRVSYTPSIDWEALSKVDDLAVTIYDVSEREKDQLQKLGFVFFGTSEELNNESTESNEETTQVED